MKHISCWYMEFVKGCFRDCTLKHNVQCLVSHWLAWIALKWSCLPWLFLKAVYVILYVSSTFLLSLLSNSSPRSKCKLKMHAFQSRYRLFWANSESNLWHTFPADIIFWVCFCLSLLKVPLLHYPSQHLRMRTQPSSSMHHTNYVHSYSI